MSQKIRLKFQSLSHINYFFDLPFLKVPDALRN